MHILVLHQFFLMPGMPGGSRFNELAALWSAAGHEVTVIAGNLDYTTGEVPARYRGKWVVREQDGPVAVYRCHVPGTYNTSYLGRMWSFFGFTLSASTAVLLARRPDVAIATSPPLVIALPGILASRLRRKRVPWVFEVRDLWPESAVTTGVLKANSLLTKALYKLEALACRAADRVNVLTPAFEEDLVKRGLVAADAIIFVPNGADPETFTPGPRDNNFRREMGWGDKVVVLYAGAHGRANALMQLVEAAERLRDRPDILIASIGDGPERKKLIDEAARRKLDNIVFPGAQPKARMPEVIRACDIGAAVLQNNPTFRTVYPNKVFDYMACERPVLLAIDGVARKMVCDEARAGVFAQPEDADALAAEIRTLADDELLRRRLGASGRAWVVANVSREGLARKYLSELSKLIAA